MSRSIFRTASAPSFVVAALLTGAAPLTAATLTVSKTADTNDGVCNVDCSLREAIAVANGNGSGVTDTIAFGIAGTFSPTSALPAISTPTILDGTTAPGWSSAPVVRIDGASAGAAVDGLVVSAASSSIKGVAVTGFTGVGVRLNGASGSISRSYLGLALDGTTDAGNGLDGVYVNADDCAVGAYLTGNKISGNGAAGIYVATGADSVDIISNYIGTDAAGTAAVPNGTNGIYGRGGTGGLVGGGFAGSGNVIAGNTGGGIVLDNTSSGWSIQGNNIGVDATGAGPLGNAGGGISLQTDGHSVGSTFAAGRNIISANTYQGISIGSGADLATIYGNHIGLNGAGTAAVGTQPIGIRVFGTNCTIGGLDATTRNVISGNTSDGVSIEDPTAGCEVSANYIGLNAAGTAAIPNGGYGIRLAGSGNTAGGDTVGERNVVSGNSGGGIRLGGTGGNTIQGNYIGTNPAGTAAIANGGNGIRAFEVQSGTIGGVNAGEGNLISGNASSAIELNAGTVGVVVRGNYIGTNVDGTAAIPNGSGIDAGGSAHIIGGTTAAARNLISGNSGSGVTLRGTNQVVYGNYIGTNAAGTAAVPNGSYGINAYEGSGHQIGGAGAGEGNLVSGNTYGGINVAGTANIVRGNKVGTNAAGNAAVANGGGISLHGSGHTVGGGTAGARNIVSGNPGGGFYLDGSGHVVLGNYVGVNAAGTAAIGNGSYGLRADTVDNVTIGGYTAAEANVFAGNSRGLNFGYGSHDNTVVGNIIGLDATATTNLADTGTGIEIDGSWDNQIGLPGYGNVIAGMSYQGISISGADSHGNTVRGNWIGTNKALATGLGNSFAGVFITDSSNNTIGGTGAGDGNVLANNYQFGIWVERGEGNEISGNSIYGNYFGIDIDAQGFFPNDGGDGDDGGNRRQNYPLISSAVVNGGVTDVEGLLINEPNTEYRVEFFSSPDCGNAGFGQGKTFRGSTQVVTGGGGQAVLTTSIPQPISDDFLTATVTDPAGNTSEFSPCAQVDLGENAGKFQFDRTAYVGYEGILPTTKVIVTRSHGLSGTATVNFTTSNGSAVAGADYTDSDQLLTFAPWEVVKHVEVPILLEVAPEPDYEKVLLALTSPTGGASLGTPATSEIQIIDFTQLWPGVTVGDAFVTEGNAGQKMLAFDVTVTATDHQVKLHYFPEPGSAVEGDDYLFAEADLTFPASASTQVQQAQIPILGDTSVEGDEIVWLRLTSAENGGNWIAYDVYGRGEIRNDDFSTPAPSNTIFADGFEIGTAALWSGAVP